MKIRYEGKLFTFWDKIFMKKLQKGGKAQTILDMEIVKDSAKYAPFDSGTLAHTVEGIGSGLITYKVPYGRNPHRLLLPERCDEAADGKAPAVQQGEERTGGAVLVRESQGGQQEEMAGHSQEGGEEWLMNSKTLKAKPRMIL